MARAMREDPSIYARLCNQRTRNGLSFASVIKPGVDARCFNSKRPPIGLVAGEAECYTVFADAFEPAIKAFHGSLPTAPCTPALDPGIVSSEQMDPSGKCIMSVGIRMSRNLSGIRMTPACTFDERQEVERVLSQALLDLTGEFVGEYFPLQGSGSYMSKPNGMHDAALHMLKDSGLLFQGPKTPFSLAAGIGRDWPHARGVFANVRNDFAAWINEEEHLSLFVKRKDGNLKEAFGSLCRAESAIGLALEQQGYVFARDTKYGFLTAFPERLGTTMTVSVTVKLPNIASLPDLSEFLGSFGLAAASVSRSGVMELTNKSTLGVSEAPLVNAVLHGVSQVIAAEAVKHRSEQCK